MSQPGKELIQTTPTNDPSLDIGALDPSQSPVEQLRSLMQSAPNYRDNLDTADYTERFAYGSYAPRDSGSGMAISEKTVPEQGLQTKEFGSRSHHTMYDSSNDSPVWDYANASILTSYVEEDRIAAPLAVLGYRAHSLKSDERGSRIITVEYPDDQTFNERLTEFGIDNLTVATFEAAGVDPTDHRAVVEAFAKGQVLYRNEEEKLTKVPMFGLLGKEFTTALQARATEIVESGDVDLMRMMDTTISASIHMRMTAARDIAKAFNNPFDGPSYANNAQSLGFELRMMLERGSESLPVEVGDAMAISVINHMRKMAGLPTITQQIEGTVDDNDLGLLELPSGSDKNLGNEANNYQTERLKLGHKLGAAIMARRARR